jgi:hypothetical protein
MLSLRDNPRNVVRKEGELVRVAVDPIIKQNNGSYGPLILNDQQNVVDAQGLVMNISLERSIARLGMEKNHPGTMSIKITDKKHVLSESEANTVLANFEKKSVAESLTVDAMAQQNPDYTFEFQVVDGNNRITYEINLLLLIVYYILNSRCL